MKNNINKSSLVKILKVGIISLIIILKVDAKNVKKFIYNLGVLPRINNIVNVAVIGSGPAGDSAALGTSRAGFHTVVFQGPKPGGQLTGTTEVENWPGIAKTPGPVIMDNLQKQAQKSGAFFSSETIEKVNFTKWPFELYTNTDKKISALTVVVATGTSPRKLHVPGELEYWGRGVMSCAVCDSPFTKDSKVIVIGGVPTLSLGEGQSESIATAEIIIEQVLQLAVYAKEIVIVLPTHNEQLINFLKHKLQDYPQVTLKSKIKINKILGNGQKVVGIETTQLETGKKEKLSTDWVFLATGHDPNTDLFKNQLDLDSKGYIKLGCHTQETSIPGVVSAGNVSNRRYRQASTSSGDGVKAGIDITDFIRRKLALDEKTLDTIKSRLYKPDQDDFSKEESKLESITTIEEFKKKTSAELKKLLAFVIYSPLCSDCKQAMPLIESLSKKHLEDTHFCKINIMEAQDLVKKIDVSSVPTLLFWHKGKQIGNVQLQGNITRDKISKVIESTHKSLFSKSGELSK